MQKCNFVWCLTYRALKKILERGMEEVAASCKKFHLEKLDYFCSPDVLRVSNNAANMVNKFLYNSVPKFVYLFGSII
jgi:hypothetical protein